LAWQPSCETNSSVADRQKQSVNSQNANDV
jgi:hypothetical protein